MLETDKPKWPENAMVGYIDIQATGSMKAITASQIQAYNVIIVAFTDPDGTLDAALWATVEPILKNAAPGTLKLLSYGGAGASAAPSPLTAVNLVNTAKTLRLHGIDLDIEDNKITTANYNLFATTLKKLGQ
ncbi:glycosyl hydrolase family 18 protein [Kordiimonas lipolytica]|uniref:Glycosyl hydrolase family 18 protein n=2 Tax=Kordiimonas lipolytica TaxID=1662421 RepID=A0ABV8UBX7_9PROT